MSKLSGLRTRLRRAFQRRAMDQQMLDEMKDHLDQETARRIAAGEDPATARRRAAAAFGSVDARVEEVRENRLGSWLEQLWQDLRFAARQLRKSPGFTLVAVATIALGVGANTAIFSGVDAVLLRPLPYPDADRLVRVFETVPKGGGNAVSGGAFVDWYKHQTQFEGLFIAAGEQVDLTGSGAPEKVSAASVSSDFDEVLGLAPVVGRHFTAADDEVGGQNNVVMISESFWQTRFAGSPNAIGQLITLDGVPREIIGVVPHGMWHSRETQLFLPLVLTPNNYRTSFDVHMGRVFGRLKPDASLTSAVTELRAIKSSLDATYPEWMHTWGVGAEPMQDMFAKNPRPFLLMLSAATALVLLIACANVANLLLARSATRQREIALRAALGASSGRIVRQVLTESTLLALIGGGAGLLVAFASIRVLATASADLLPATMVPQLDLRVLGFGLFSSILIGLIFGIFPALRARNPDLNHSLKCGTSNATDGGRSRSQSSLVIAEIALTAVLLVSTGLLVRGMVRTVTADPGITAENVLMFELTPPYSGGYASPTQRIEFIQRVRSELLAVPGAVAVASADDLPFGDSGQGYFISREDAPETRQDRTGRIKYVSHGYFDTLGARIVRGRAISSADNRLEAPDVMVINETMAGQLFGPDTDPLGKLVHAKDQPWEVVGVVSDIRIDSLTTDPQPTFFVPHTEFVWWSGFIVRTQGDPAAMLPALSAAVHHIDPNLPLARVQTLEHAMGEALGPQRLTLNLIGVFAIMALSLAAIGLYGVMAFAVANRRRELSIRVALGAARADIMQLILRHGGRLLLIGLGLGLVAGIGAARVAANLMTNVSATDPLVFIVAALLLAFVTALACYLPARRAAKADPIQALRSD
ncbi:ABC transporter permease [Synoicihabitans lomoniglobus]|uniref:ABC transporter permease n=1 Tax=Synoicihabitans lomoniglobus TaxID=2909285 RepID=A0AAE9ZVQ4_9BACT|nr:ABC transporter permease [Opitutaceae bacterium LMO-M01]WED63338.1 ABC transporter permease [Opitutaceae bacterium LMO-M01]